MNPMAKIYRTENSAIDLDKVLNVGGFDLKRALELEPDFLKAAEEHEHDHDHDHDHERSDERTIITSMSTRSITIITTTRT